MNLAKKYKQLFEGKTRSNDSRLLNESNVKVTSHDEPYEDAIEFEGTINGKPWTATKEWMQDGAIFTSVYDENDDDLQDKDDSAYDDVLSAISDYMEKKNLVRD